MWNREECIETGMGYSASKFFVCFLINTFPVESIKNTVSWPSRGGARVAPASLASEPCVWKQREGVCPPGLCRKDVRRAVWQPLAGARCPRGWVAADLAI